MKNDKREIWMETNNIFKNHKTTWRSLCKYIWKHIRNGYFYREVNIAKTDPISLKKPKLITFPRANRERSPGEKHQDEMGSQSISNKSEKIRWFQCSVNFLKESKRKEINLILYYKVGITLILLPAKDCTKKLQTNVTCTWVQKY